MIEGDYLSNKKETKSNSETKKSNRNLFIILFLSTLLTISVAITIWAFSQKNTSPTLAPDYAPQKSESNAEKIENEDNDEKLPQQNGGGAVSLTYSKDVGIDLSNKKARLLFANPSKSNQDMLLKIAIQDEVILQSGIISPGFQVKSLDLFENVKLSAGKYQGELTVYYYQQDSKEKAMLNTKIPLTITVEE